MLVRFHKYPPKAKLFQCLSDGHIIPSSRKDFGYLFVIVSYCGPTLPGYKDTNHVICQKNVATDWPSRCGNKLKLVGK